MSKRDDELLRNIQNLWAEIGHLDKKIEGCRRQLGFGRENNPDSLLGSCITQPIPELAKQVALICEHFGIHFERQEEKWLVWSTKKTTEEVKK